MNIRNFLVLFSIILTQLLTGCISLSDKSESIPLTSLEVEAPLRYPSSLTLQWNKRETPGFYQYRLYIDTIPLNLDTIAPHTVLSFLNDTTITVKALTPNEEYYVVLDVVTASGINRSAQHIFSTTSPTIEQFTGEKSGSMVRIPSGSFWYYQEKSVIDTIITVVEGDTTTELEYKNVNDSTIATISRDFYMDSTELTKEIWASVMGDSTPVENTPMNNRNWFDILLFCNERSKLEGFDTAYVYDSIVRSAFDDRIVHMVNLNCEFYNGGYRLPTEDEWIYAYKAGSGPGFYWGVEQYPADSLTYPATAEDSLQMNEYVWWSYNKIDSLPVAVAQKKPNAWGLYDMGGNVQEYLWNHYNNMETYENRVDYHGALLDEEYNARKKFKGGDYTGTIPLTFMDWTPSRWFSASRIKENILGFRTVRTPEELVR